MTLGWPLCLGQVEVYHVASDRWEDRKSNWLRDILRGHDTQVWHSCPWRKKWHWTVLRSWSWHWTLLRDWNRHWSRLCLGTGTDTGLSSSRIDSGRTVYCKTAKTLFFLCLWGRENVESLISEGVAADSGGQGVLQCTLRPLQNKRWALRWPRWPWLDW